jgi:autotransporter-associated beta strand protein
LTNVDDMSGLSVAELQFTAGGYSISGTHPLTLIGSSGVGIDNTTGTNAFSAPITLGANLAFTEEAGTLSLGGAIGGSHNLTQGAGGTAGTLVLGGSNTYSGTTTVSAGTLSISADSNLGAAPGSATPGSLTLNGGELATTASFTLNANRGISLGASGDTIDTIDTIDVAGGTTLTYNGIAAGSGSLAETDTGTLVLGHANTYTGVTGLFSGTLQLGASNAIPSTSDVIDDGTLNLDGHGDTIGALSGGGTVTSSVAGSVTLTVGATNNSNVFSGVIQNGSGTLALTKAGTGVETLSGADTYTGVTTINAGTLSISADNGLGTAPGSATAGSLVLNGGTLGTTATFTLNANRGISLGASGGTIDVANGTTLTYSGIAAGSGNLTLTDAGTLALGGANTYTGTTTISAGTLQVGASNAIPSTSDVTDGGTLDLDLNQA